VCIYENKAEIVNSESMGLSKLLHCFKIR